MSLSARIELEPSLCVGRVEAVFPLLGLIVAATTLATRWPTHLASVLAAAGIVFVMLAAFALRRLSSTRTHYRLTISSHAEIDLWSSTRPAADGSARLVESTVVWPGLWMIALRSEGNSPVVRLQVLPSGLSRESRWALGRFLVWSMSVRSGALDEREKADD